MGMRPKSFFTDEDRQEIMAAIARAEALSSGEIRVHLAHRLDTDPMTAAKKIFADLGMAATRERNGILFLLITGERRLILLGDQGIHDKVPPDYWQGIVDQALEEFKHGRFVEGLTRGIEACGQRLAQYFPPRGDDRNELTDDVSED